jgi:hypothetical protein
MALLCDSSSDRSQHSIQIRVFWSAGNKTRSTDKPLGVAGAWFTPPV